MIRGLYHALNVKICIFLFRHLQLMSFMREPSAYFWSQPAQCHHYLLWGCQFWAGNVDAPVMKFLLLLIAMFWSLLFQPCWPQESMCLRDPGKVQPHQFKGEGSRWGCCFGDVPFNFGFCVIFLKWQRELIISLGGKKLKVPAKLESLVPPPSLLSSVNNRQYRVW